MADDDQHGDEAVKESVNRFDHEKEKTGTETAAVRAASEE